MTDYHYLRHNEIIQAGDEVDGCRDSWRDDPVWLPVHENSIGQPAPDPRYPAHRVYRRKKPVIRDWGELPVWML